jgi:dCMP deaminase
MDQVSPLLMTSPPLATWEEYFKDFSKKSDEERMLMVYRLAAEKATDPSTQNGAVIYNPQTKTVVGIGANHFPLGVVESTERWERPLKYSFVEHAERSAIYYAAREGNKTAGGIMYCAWAACSDCSRAIIEARISELVTHYNPLNPERFGKPVSAQWRESVRIGMTMLAEAGVKVRLLENPMTDDLSIRFDGGQVKP